MAAISARDNQLHGSEHDVPRGQSQVERDAQRSVGPRHALAGIHLRSDARIGVVLVRRSGEIARETPIISISDVIVTVV